MAFRQWYGTVGPLPAILVVGALVAVAAVVTAWQPLSSMLLLGPVLAGIRLGPRPTAAVTFWSVALSAAIYVSRGGAPLPDTVLFCLVQLGCGGAAVCGAYRRATLEAEVLRAVRQSQNAVLRPLALEVGGVGITSRHHAVDRSGLSGDLYDLAHSPYGLRVVIGDVRGHGPEAALLCAATVCAFRDGAYTTPALVDLATYLDARINPALGAEDFVTVVLAEFAQGEVRLVNCGHPAPLRVGRRAEPLPPRQHSPPLGLNPVPGLQRVRLGAGQRLLLYTDGLSEARDAEGTMLALDEAVRQALCQPLLGDSLDALVSLVTAHTGGVLQDDLALVICEPRAAVRSERAAGSCGPRGDAPAIGP
ncbi:serine/threonine-protein phosphatase [Streptomyces sp. NBC_00237]|uniref:PP2C family protein-serine/threonine phosphatase n=1 Tax=Streptomyces sp. NBC_00237 TaxID=2975687 RepID=UPI00224D90BE|nr:PP2C family protein-serine/threonine phosphatase [Streptomyces sp. NBC_00237]MCX5203174.1 serine/threonine-protein phosphatase [Streptomyces sp. NBC_00237]